MQGDLRDWTKKMYVSMILQFYRDTPLSTLVWFSYFRQVYSFVFFLHGHL